MNINKFFAILLVAAFFQSCSSGNGDSAAKNSPLVNPGGKKYTLFLYQDNYDDPGGDIKLDSTAIPITANNDTVAYFTALKKFYNQKVIERKDLHFGQPRSFMITDKNGIDLKATLSDKIIEGLKAQVENMPEVKLMIEQYRQDSL